MKGPRSFRPSRAGEDGCALFGDPQRKSTSDVIGGGPGDRLPLGTRPFVVQEHGATLFTLRTHLSDETTNSLSSVPHAGTLTRDGTAASYRFEASGLRPSMSLNADVANCNATTLGELADHGARGNGAARAAQRAAPGRGSSRADTVHRAGPLRAGRADGLKCSAARGRGPSSPSWTSASTLDHLCRERAAPTSSFRTSAWLRSRPSAPVPSTT